MPIWIQNLICAKIIIIILKPFNLSGQHFSVLSPILHITSLIIQISIELKIHFVEDTIRNCTLNLTPYYQLKRTTTSFNQTSCKSNSHYSKKKVKGRWSRNLLHLITKVHPRLLLKSRNISKTKERKTLSSFYCLLYFPCVNL